ncbi:DegT/DnrJ/EryC1/StrS family aminotransferase [Candidatus Woesearchaeota archaeon]|nr:DegT/DnrJ/EryC1/StrS family aminotransferase [Candidatus Woesearchaeota archaeon]
MKVNFVDLQRQTKLLYPGLLKAITGVLERADFIQGKAVEEFEQAFARFCNKKYCVALNSGTDALEFALRAYGIQDGEVITAPNSYFSSAMVISKVGATPIFVDVDAKSFNIDVTKLEQAITKKTKAIIPVHLCGQSADLDPIYALAKKHNLVVIEDACQSHGAGYKGKKVPVGETGAFSFYPGKNLGCFGDGGALVTDNEQIAQQVRLLRNDGSRVKYHHEVIGSKSRLDTLQAVILQEKLPHLAQWNEQRRKAAHLYNQLLKDVVTTPTEMPYATHVYHLYMIQVDDRDGLQKYLADKGISTVIHYPIPIHLQPVYASLGHKEGSFPVTERLAKRILSLPMFPEITAEEIRYVADAVKEFVQKS